MQLQRRINLSKSRVMSIPVLIAALILVTVIASGCASPQSDGPQLWQVKEAGIDQTAFDHDGMWTDYRLPPDYKADSGGHRGGLPLNVSIEEVDAREGQPAAHYKSNEKLQYRKSCYEVSSG